MKMYPWTQKCWNFIQTDEVYCHSFATDNTHGNFTAWKFDIKGYIIYFRAMACTKLNFMYSFEDDKKYSICVDNVKDITVPLIFFSGSLDNSKLWLNYVKFYST